MPEPTNTGAIPTASPQRTGNGQFQPGQSGNPSGRPKTNYALIEALERALDAEAMEKLATKVVALALSGDTTMIKYLYDRFIGLPVQRHEAKLEYDVRETARRLAKEQGLSEEDVMKQAEDILRGR